MHPSAVNLNLLVVLDVLLSEKNVGQAATRLTLSQPAVSHSLNKLRDLFNDDLFIKTSSGMKLTAFAEGVQSEVHEIIKKVDVLVNKNLDFDPIATARIFTIGMVEYGEMMLLPKLIQWRRKNKSKILIRTVSLVNQDVDLLLDKGAIDLAITTKYKVPQRMVEDPLAKEKFVCICWKDHPILKEEKTLDNYLRYPHVIVPEVYQRDFSLVHQALGDRRKEREAVLTVSHYTVLPYVLQGSYLIATIIEDSAKDFAKNWDLTVWPCPVKVENLQVIQVWHKRNNNDSGHEWLRSFFKSACEASQ